MKKHAIKKIKKQWMNNYETELETKDESEICEFPYYYLSSNGITKRGKNDQDMCAFSHTKLW